MLSVSLPIAEVLQDREQVLSVLRESRNLFGLTTTTREQYAAMEKTLGLAYVYCPEGLQDMVLATLEEAQRRKVYFEQAVWETISIPEERVSVVIDLLRDELERRML